MDQYYYEEGYIDSGYHVYIGDAIIDLRPYIEDNYIDPSYYEYYGITTTLTGELSLVTGELEEASASLSSAFTQSAVAIKTVDAVSIQTSAFTQTVTAIRIMQIEAAFTDAFAPVMTVNAIRNSFAVLDAQASLSVDAVANRAANVTLESIVNQSLSGDRFRDYASAQTVTATQSTSAVKSVVASSTQSSAFTLNVTISGPAKASANLSSKFQLLTAKYINGQRPITLTASGSDNGFCTAGQSLGSRTGIVKYGTYAYYLGAGTSNTLVSEVDTTFVPAANEQFVFEFWWNNFSDKGGTADPVIASLGANATTITSLINTTAWAIGVENDYLQARFQTANNTWTTISTTTSYSGTGFRHLALLRGSDGVVRFYKNGTEIGNASYSGALFINTPETNSTIRLRANNWNIPSPGGVVFDEVSYRIGRSELAGSTSAVVNDPDTQKLLYHFENNLDDDIVVTYSMQAALTSTASVTAQLTGSVFAQSSMSTTSSVVANVGIVKSADSAISSAFTQSTDIQRIRSGASTQLAEFTQTASADITRTVDASISSAFSQTATGLRIQEGAAAFDAVASQLAAVAKIGDFLISCDVIASQTTVAVKTTNVVSTQSSAFTQNADGIKAVEVSATVVAEFTQSSNVRRLAGLTSNQNSAFTQTSDVNYTAENISNQNATSSLSVDAAGSTVGFASAMSAEFTQSAAFDRFRNTSSNQNSEFTQSTNTANSYIRGFDSELSSNADVAVSGLRIKQGSANFDAVASQLTAAAKIGDFLVAADVISTLNANINVTAAGVSTQTAEFTQNANGVKNAVSSAQVNSEFTQVAVAIKAVNATGNFNSEFTLTADPVKATDAISIEVGTFTQTTNAVKTASGASNFESIAFELSAGERIRDVNAEIVTTASVSVVAGKRVNASSTINSAMNFVVGFKVIHITAELTYKIPRENWTYKIQRENREFIIREEDREYKIRRG